MPPYSNQVASQILFDRVETDDTMFHQVTFDGAELVYRGGNPPAFDRCRFLDVTFTFEDSAASTLDYLRLLSEANPTVQTMIADLLPALSTKNG